LVENSFANQPARGNLCVCLQTKQTKVLPGNLKDRDQQEAGAVRDGADAAIHGDASGPPLSRNHRLPKPLNRVSQLPPSRRRLKSRRVKLNRVSRVNNVSNPNRRQPDSPQSQMLSSR
jgi:hypothetical protein